ncbi:hypothetical protein [Candidatus Coxiella mudrowiae]|uniref:hypothetical protein n=1 Tax=Candidatus Coxiella mudrowiae TaxID=2054173 RepID=UPI0012FF0DE5|nr:hypothetical protein [Candidatus Coxiella mudrowiae]
MSKADIAHAIMMIEEELIPQLEGSILLSALLQLDKCSLVENLFDPSFGDVYTNQEHYFKEQIGASAGWLHAGQARRECSTIGLLLAMRKRLLRLAESLVALSKAILEQASKNLETIMPDFTYLLTYLPTYLLTYLPTYLLTYLKYAQPTTFAHYLLTFKSSLLRDFKYLEKYFNCLNHSLLVVVLYARDAMSCVDIPLENYSNLVAIAVNINRLIEEIQI